jgi:hypothetical protein
MLRCKQEGMRHINENKKRNGRKNDKNVFRTLTAGVSA